MQNTEMVHPGGQVPRCLLNHLILYVDGCTCSGTSGTGCVSTSSSAANLVFHPHKASPQTTHESLTVAKQNLKGASEASGKGAMSDDDIIGAQLPAS